MDIKKMLGISFLKAEDQSEKTRKIQVLRRALTALLLLAVAAPTVAAETVPGDGVPKIQLALLLDTSNSMDGLIGQAQAQLWRVVNEFVSARRDEKRPILEVALYEYGNSGLNSETNWIRQVLPFSTDLDLLSERLFALKTNGGDEYCGAVLQNALDKLVWSDAPVDLKTVFIAGNEPFDQGPSDYRAASARAMSAGIIVNTIFCGDRNAGVSTFWQDGASLGDGDYFHIDQNRVAVQIKTPQYDEIERLGLKLNGTYLPYGARGRFGISNQVAQDSNASSLSSTSNVSRQIFKGSHLYSNGNWDLVDAQRDGAVTVEGVPAADLPEAMRAMSPSERVAYVESKRAEREAIQKQIAALGAARAAYIAEKRSTSDALAPESLDTAMIAAVRKMAEKKGFNFG